MDQAYLAQSGVVGGTHVLLHDRDDVARMEGVQVERRFDRNGVGIVGHGDGGPQAAGMP
jgi:hypothetical protein